METENQEVTQESKIGIIPIAFLIAIVLIAGAYIYKRGDGEGRVVEDVTGTEQEEEISFRGVQQNDHVRGNLDAKISIIEFSDFECAFCARIHPTLARLVDENTDVNWVYRHFPLTSIHSRARDAAVASECVAKLGGNDAFWEFSDSVFENQNKLGSDLYEEIASDLGINKSEYNSCLLDRQIVERVFTDLNEAINNGGRGTPFSVVVAADGSLSTFSGALPYETIRDLVDQILAQ